MSRRRDFPPNVSPSSREGDDRGGTGPPEPELPAGLKPFEAALGSLSPRRDCLDYDLIMFRAGRLSAGAEVPRAVPARSAVRPAVLGAISGVAATLLVVMLTRPEPQTVERIRGVPAGAGQGTSEAGPSASDASRTDAADTGSPDSRPRRPQAPSRRAAFALSKPTPTGRPAWDGHSGGKPSLEIIDRILREGADPWEGPIPMSAQPTLRPTAPRPYLEQRRTMLDDQACAEPLPVRDDAAHRPGASS